MKYLLVLSGGMDCSVVKWNASKKKEFYTIDFSGI